MKRNNLFVLAMVFSLSAFAGSNETNEALETEKNVDSSSVAAFNACMENNQSLLIQSQDLMTLCLVKHSQKVDNKEFQGQGRYIKTDQGERSFSVQLVNSTSDKIVTSYAVILKHNNQEEAQIFRVSPVGILPGKSTVATFSALDYQPKNDQEVEGGQFQFGIDAIFGLKLDLK